METVVEVSRLAFEIAGVDHAAVQLIIQRTDFPL
jgi:hypothetical protein